MQNEMPPLPSGWRDTIDRATSRDNRIFDDVMADIDGNNESRPSSVLGASRREQASSPSTNHGFDSYSVLEYDKEGGIALSPSPISWLQSPRRSRKRTLPSVSARHSLGFAFLTFFHRLIDHLHLPCPHMSNQDGCCTRGPPSPSLQWNII